MLLTRRLDAQVLHIYQKALRASRYGSRIIGMIIAAVQIKKEEELGGRWGVAMYSKTLCELESPWHNANSTVSR